MPVAHPLTIALVYNPQLAPSRRAKVSALTAELERRGHRITHHAGDNFDAARDAPDADCLCLCGGDGTARLVIGNQGDPGRLPPIAIFPIGTINLLARELRFPSDPARFADRLERNAPPLRHRLAVMNGVPFLACASIGFDAEAVASVSERLKLRIGRLAYAVAAMALITRWPRCTMQIDTSDGNFTAEALFVLRGKFYAGPWTLDRGANLGVERLRLLALPKARRRDIVALMLYAVTGSHTPPGRWQFREVDWAKVSAAIPIPLQADGDMAGTTPADFAMTAHVIRFR